MLVRRWYDDGTTLVPPRFCVRNNCFELIFRRGNFNLGQKSGVGVGTVLVRRWYGVGRESVFLFG